MRELPRGLESHRIQTTDPDAVLVGTVRWAPAQSLWFTGNAVAAIAGGAMLFRWDAFALFIASTGIVLLLGHSLGSHRKLIHDSFQCPRWLERVLVYLGVQVGLAGPIGLLRQHELRDFAQRLPDCHPYLRHGSRFWVDAWWQLHCQLHLARPPPIRIEERISSDAFYRFLERTWRWQQLPIALLFYAWGGWSFVVFGVCARVTAGVFGHWLIGYFAHNHGPMGHEVRGAAVQGHNVRWTSLLTMGECWHNNHHAYPGSARLGLAPGEWDPGWWMLLLLQRVGLAGSMRLPQDLPPRPELVRVSRHAPPSRSRLLAALRMLRGPASAAGGLLVWPGRTVGLAGMRRLVRPAIEARVDPRAPRLLLSMAGASLRGLPALGVAVLAHRGKWARFAGWLILPPALALEYCRDRRACSG